MTARRILRAAFACALSAATLVSPSTAGALPRDAVADAVLGKGDFTEGAPNAPSASAFGSPWAVVVDPRSGELWVADPPANRVLRFASASAFANGEAANLVLGQSDFTASAANRGGAVSASSMRSPAGLAIDALGRLYVADQLNHRILVFKPPFANGMAASAVVGQINFQFGLVNRGQSRIVASGFRTPTGLALDAEGNLWVADSGNARVLRLFVPAVPGGTTPGASVSARYVVGQVAFDTAATAVTATGLTAPVAVAVDSRGDLWVADLAQNRVLRYDRNLASRGAAANLVLCQPDFVTATASAGSTGCGAPSGLAFDTTGNLHVVDANNHRVLRFEAPGANGAAASAVYGQADYASRTCNRNAALPGAATLCLPRAAAFDSAGNLVVADSANHRVLRFDEPIDAPVPVLAEVSPRVVALGSVPLELTVTGAGFRSNTGVRWNGAERPTRFLAEGRLVATLPAADFLAAGAFEVSVSTAGRTSAAATVQVEATAPGDPIADRLLGRPDFASCTGRSPAVGSERHGFANAALTNTVRGIAIDPVTGRLFVTDGGNARILSWPSAAAFGNAQPADLVIGQPDFHSADCNAGGLGARTLCDPEGLHLDERGRLYVPDAGNHRVLRFDPPFSNGMAASRVWGQRGDFTTNLPNPDGPDARSFSRPDAAVTSGSRLFVRDADNFRVLVIDDADTNDVARAAIGQPDLVSATQEPASATRLPTFRAALAVDAEGRLHVLEEDANRVVRFSAPFASGMAADLVLGQPDFTSAARAVSATGLNSPRGIAFDAAGHLLVADQDGARVLRYRAPLATGMAASDVIGPDGFDQPGPVTGRRAVATVQDVAVDSAGSVYASRTDGCLVAFDRPFGDVAPARPRNVSTRLAVLQGEDVLIGGFIVGGTRPKTVVIRARGPSLAAFGVPNVLADPVLQVFSGGTMIDANDDWQADPRAGALAASGYAPSSAAESALLLTLAAGPYTAIVSGAGGGTGVGIVEVFEVDEPASPLVNLSTRGRVQTGADVMIGGFIIEGDSPRTVVVRARGPSLAAEGIADPLANPVLQLFAGDGTPLLANDDWQQAANAQALAASGFAPPDAREAAILVTLAPGAYTAIVTGAGGATGVAIVEVFTR